MSETRLSGGVLWPFSHSEMVPTVTPKASAISACRALTDSRSTFIRAPNASPTSHSATGSPS